MTDFEAIQQKYYEFAEIANDHFERLNPEIENYVNALEELNKEMLQCLIWEFKASVKHFGIEKAKGLQTRYAIEKATGQSIEEVLKR